MNVEAKLIAAWSASVKLNDGGDAEEESMPIPRKEKKAV